LNTTISGISGILNGTINGAAGSAQGREGTTITTFAISLAAGFILFAVQFGMFLVIRNYL
jgi:calcium permeable stress-gated cation channel